MSRVLPCMTPRGPKDAKIFVCGEAPGEQEEYSGMPFIGSAGQELDRMAEEAGIALRKECWLTNVLLTRPPANKFDAFCISKKELPNGYNLPSVSQGRYLHPEFGVELTRLYGELEAIKPNIIIALGNPALWALTGMSGIGKVRGTVQTSRWGKILPTFHPSHILRGAWDKRPIVVADLIKAKRESEFPDVRRPERYVLANPTFSEVAEWVDIAVEAPYLSLDVETKAGQITEFGCAYSTAEAISIPFVDYRKPGNSYWGPEEELGIRKHIQRLLICPAKKIFQNGLYDLQYLIKEGYKIKNVAEDTMLQHHAMYPEMQKSLGFLGSIYTNEASWKLLRHRVKDHAVKREDH